MKTFNVMMRTSFEIEAESADEAENKAIELCADDPEMLMPHNMNIVVE